MNENTKILSTILDIYREAESYSEHEALEIIYNFALDCNKNRSGLLYYIKARLEESRFEAGLCEECATPTIVEVGYDNSSEYLGMPVSEQIYTKVCPNCHPRENLD